MNLIIFPGNSRHNKDWADKLNMELSSCFKSIILHNYRHWDSGEKRIDLNHELLEVCKKTDNTNPYLIIAKSIGCVLALKGMFENKLNPSRCVFIGLPLKLIINENTPVLEWFNGIDIPITIIQNDNDPVGTYEEVKEFLKIIDNTLIKFEKFSGDTHSYLDFDKIREIALKT